MAGNPFSGQLQGLGIQGAEPQGGTAQDQPGDALPGGRAARRMRRAARKASQGDQSNLIAPSQVPGKPVALSPQHVMNGRSHQHSLEKTGK